MSFALGPVGMNSRWRRLILVGGCLAASGVQAGQREARIEERLRRFREDPARVMGELPEKTRQDGTVLSSGESIFPLEKVRDGSFRRFKAYGSELRLRSARLDFSGPWTPDDSPSSIAGKLRFGRLDKARAAGLDSGKVEVEPWSDDYWPIAQGGLAKRYSDPEFPKGFDWKKIADYVESNAGSCSVDQLSPAEKYDLIVGSSTRELTQAAIKEGRPYWMREGSVARWMGICHGWAPASFSVARPQKSIEVMAADGRTRVRLYPSDIKAMVSLLLGHQRLPHPLSGTALRGAETADGCQGSDDRSSLL